MPLDVVSLGNSFGVSPSLISFSQLLGSLLHALDRCVCVFLVFFWVPGQPVQAFFLAGPWPIGETTHVPNTTCLGLAYEFHRPTPKPKPPSSAWASVLSKTPWPDRWSSRPSGLHLRGWSKPRHPRVRCGRFRRIWSHGAFASAGVGGDSIARLGRPGDQLRKRSKRSMSFSQEIQVIPYKSSLTQ